jgi:WD40 repeat protein
LVLLTTTLAYGVIYLWRPHPVLTLRPHGGRPVTGLAFSPDCTLLATAGEDYRLAIWKVPSGQEKLAFTAHHGFVTCVAFAPNGDTLFSGGEDGRIASWDPRTGQELEFGKAGQAVRAIAVSPDSRRIASAGNDGWLRVWDIATREECLRFSVPRTPLCSIAYAPDGKHLAIGDLAETVHLLEADSGRLVTSVTRNRVGLNVGIAFSPDGKLLALEGPRPGGLLGGAIQLLDAATGQPVLHFPPAHSSGVSCLAFSNDGKWLASGSGGPRSGWAGEVIVWDAEHAKQLATLHGHDDGPTAVAFTRTGKYLATASRDGTVNLWDLDRVIPPSR